MTLQELINQSLELGKTVTSCDIPLKNCGEDFTIEMEVKKDAEDELYIDYIDVKTYAGDKEVKLFNFPICV